MRQPAELLGVVGRAAVRRHEPIRDDVVDLRMSRTAREADVGGLHRRRSMRRDARPAPSGVELQVEQNIQLVLGDTRRGLEVAQEVDRDMVLDSVEKALPVFGDIRGAIVIGEHLEPLTVVVLKHTRHEMHGGMIAEVARQIADAYTASAAALHGRGDSLYLGHRALDVSAGYAEIAGFVRAPCYVSQRKFLRQVESTLRVPRAQLALQQLAPLPLTSEACRYERATDQCRVIGGHPNDVFEGSRRLFVEIVGLQEQRGAREQRGVGRERELPAGELDAFPVAVAVEERRDECIQYLFAVRSCGSSLQQALQRLFGGAVSGQQDAGGQPTAGARALLGRVFICCYGLGGTSRHAQCLRPQ